MAKITEIKRSISLSFAENDILKILPERTSFVSEGLKFNVDSGQIIVFNAENGERYGEFSQDSVEAKTPIELVLY